MSIHVYRLVVTLPAEPPEDWHRIIYGYEPSMPTHPNEDEPRFSWPARRLYLSASGAAKRKRLLERLGAIVTVERSGAVEWSTS